MITKLKLANALTARVINELDNRSTLAFLKSHATSEYIDTLISIVYLYSRDKRDNEPIFFAEVITAIGHAVRGLLKYKKDSGIAARLGGFFLYQFEAMGMLRVVMGAGKNGHHAYVLQVLDDAAISHLWTQVEVTKTAKLPALEPYAPWSTSKHETGATLVKTGSIEVLKQLKKETHPIVFDCVNKAQTVGWTINDKLYPIYQWALRNKTDAFADIWELSNPQAKATKLREAKGIGDIAKRFVGKVFYHLYYLDFRGRKYPTTAYLHEQGSDLARGLLIRADTKPVGEDGFFWLMVSIASNWAGDSGRLDGAKTDKIPLQDRFQWSLDNEEIFLAYAEKPKLNQGWMKADKPWQFLAACMELYKLRLYQAGEACGDFEDYSYSSGLECYVDGSNNGSQHLSALTRDEITAPHVNLVPLDMPGDLYKYVGDHVWASIGVHVQEYAPEVRIKCDTYIDDLVSFKKQISAMDSKSPERANLIDRLRQYKAAADCSLKTTSAPVFWNRITDPKHKRKIVKRNVMTLPYGGTSYGLGQQQINDAKKHGIDSLYNMEHAWGAFMGRVVYEDCKTSLRRPMQLLSVFEQAGRSAEARGEFLKWNVPITNFPVVQHYTEGVTKKVWIQYGPPKGELLSTKRYENTYQINVCHLEEQVMSKGKQSQGASPNCIHSLDAAHLMLTVHRADFPITTIHDSYGCLLADMPKLFRLVRETFVELYQSDPLSSLMKDIQGDVTGVEFGTLDITLVLDSEYCFV